MKLVDLLYEHGIEHFAEGHPRCHTGWIQINCPFCDDTDFHMGYNLTGNYFNCWRCGPHKLYDVLSKLTGLDWRTCKDLGLKPTYDFNNPIRKTGVLRPPQGTMGLYKPHSEYLKKRGFDPRQIVKLWKVGGIGVGEAGYQWRIYIPIHLHGEVVSWTTRSIAKKPELRYKSAPKDRESVDAKTILYGEDYCQNACIVHEGPFDVWATGPGAVCTLTLSYSESQIERIARYPIRVICFDNEPAAQTKAKKLVNDLSVFPGETFNVVLSGKDSASSPKWELEEMRKRFLKT